jgi:hypothetical protein
MIGYALGTGLLGLIGLDSGLIPWLVGVAAGVVLAIVVIRFNVQKWVIILGSAAIGAGVIVGTFLVLFGKIPPMLISGQAVRLAMQDSVFWLLGFLALFIAGAYGQFRSTRDFMISAPADRW